MEKQKEIKNFLIRSMRGQNCIGSVNTFKNSLDGMFLIERTFYEQLKRELKSYYDVSSVKELQENQVGIKIAQKWGQRNDDFVIFD